MSQAFPHEPVMVGEVVSLFAPVPDGTVLDATVGGAGHARALLAAHPNLRLLGIDRDAEAISAARDRLAPFGERVSLHQASFDMLTDLIGEAGVGPVSGVLFDLGVSSPQFDQPERGFSLRSDAPLDMRMDRRQDRTAADVVNTYGERRLADMFRESGEGALAGRIARAIVAARPLATTGALADVVRSAVAVPRRRGNPATRVFQAIRVEVNDELRMLPGALDAAIAALAPGGRCVALSYHSGEDRVVKARFRDASTGGCICLPNLPCVCGAVPTVRLLTRGARVPTREEVIANPRASAARLRAVERLAAAA